MPVAIVLSVALLGGFWFAAVYYRAAPLGNFLRVGSAHGPITTVAAESAPAMSNAGLASPHAAAILARVAAGPMISFNFDNGYESAYLNALPIFDAAGFKTTQYMITGRIGHQDYVNEAQLRSIAKRGHEIGAQSRTLSRFSQLSEADFREEIEGSQRDLLDRGFPVATFAYPFGESNAVFEEAVRSAGFLGARSLGAGRNDTNTNVYNIIGFEVRADTLFADVKKVIDEAVAEKKWLVLVFARVDDAEAKDGRSVSSTFIKQIVQYVKGIRLPVVTTEEGLRG